MSTDEYQRMINKTEDYIEENLDKQVSLSDVANNVHVSEYHFHRLFSKYAKETLKQYITRIKMERSAICLVVDAELSLTEIAFRVGYSSSSSYNKAFKKHFGISPTSFRKSKNGKETRAKRGYNEST